MIRRFALFVFIASCSFSSFAQNTGGAFGPVVNQGHKSLQYRGAVDPDNAAGETGFAQRLHYQQAIDGDFMWRVIGQTRKTDNSDFDFDFFPAELFWELSDDQDAHRSGVRFDLRYRDADRPQQFGFNWMNQFQLNNNWSARTLVLTNVQFGNNAADGVNLQTRFQLAKRLESGNSVGVEMYNNYGNTGSIGNFDSQNHTIGPIFSAPIVSDWSLFSGVLFGISESAPDTEVRLWLTRNL